MKTSASLALIVVALFGAAGALHGATYTWDGSVNDWNSPHWLPGAVRFPGTGHAMMINGSTAFVTRFFEQAP